MCVCVCVCVNACVCARMWMHVCSEHDTCVCGCMSVEEARAGERGRQCESEIYMRNLKKKLTYLFDICYFKCTFLSPCVKGKFSFLCVVYWCIIKIYLIWFDLIFPLCLQNAFPKGEVFIGHRDAGYSIILGAPEGDRSSNSHNNYCFTLHTPDRNFILRAETPDDMEKWNTSLNYVFDLPLTPQDSKCEWLWIFDLDTPQYSKCKWCW